jgi:mono-ADP-ribosyltransferase sirtuin 6
MAWTAPKIAQKEHREASERVELGAEKLADAIRKSQHLIAFTGAGISTSAGWLPSSCVSLFDYEGSPS